MWCNELSSAGRRSWSSKVSSNRFPFLVIIVVFALLSLTLHNKFFNFHGSIRKYVKFVEECEKGFMKWLQNPNNILEKIPIWLYQLLNHWYISKKKIHALWFTTKINFHIQFVLYINIYYFLYYKIWFVISGDLDMMKMEFILMIKFNKFQYRRWV